MSASRGWLLLFGLVAAILAICTVLPTAGAACPMSSDTARAVASCDSVVAGLIRSVLIGLAVLGTVISTVLVGSMCRQVISHRRVSERLRREARQVVLDDHEVGLVAGIHAVVVAGIVRPRTYGPVDLQTRLDHDELRAVLLHERHHELTHAPAKLVVLSALAPLVGRIDRGSSWLERARARIEIEADGHALDHGATRTALARAILKLDVGSPPVTLAAFATASEIRLRALLGEEDWSGRTSPTVPALGVVVAAVVVGLCSLLSLV